MRSRHRVSVCKPSVASLTELRQGQGVITKSKCWFHPIPCISTSPALVTTNTPETRRMDYLQAEEEGIVKNLEFHKALVDIVNDIPAGRIMILVNRYAPVLSLPVPNF